jgi:hypothetical protein
MAVLFSKQYGETVVIATEKSITLVRDDERGFMMCHTFEPDSFYLQSTDYKRHARRQYDNDHARPDESH